MSEPNSPKQDQTYEHHTYKKEEPLQRSSQSQKDKESSSSEKHAEIGDPEQLTKNSELFEPSENTHDEPIQKVFQSAYHDRKYLNQAEFELYVKKRNNYFEKHVMTLQNIVFQLNGKIKETTSFIPLLIKHFHQVSDSHKAFIESCKKIEVFKYLNDQNQKKIKEKEKRIEWFPGIMKGIGMLMNLKQQTSIKHKTMDQHLTGQIIPGIEKCIQTYKKALQASLKNVEKQKDKYKEIQNTTQKKLARVQKLFQNRNQKKDWLSYELIAFEHMQKSRQQLISFGNIVHAYWKQIMAHQKQLVQSMQKVMHKLLQNYREVNSTSKQFEQYVTFWQSLQVDTDVDTKLLVSNVLALSSLDFLKSTLKVKNITRQQYTLQDFQIFNHIEIQKQIFGDKPGILITLVVKQFTVQRQGQQNTHNSLTIYSTVDHFLVFYDESNPQKTNKMQIRRLLNTRKSDYAVNVNEKIQGFLLDSWNREVIYFSSADQAQQFMFHTENNDDMKKSYLQ